MGDNNNNNKDHFLRNLNKLSHKITKPISDTSFIHRPPPPPPPLPPLQQPPVYNINKSDFRDVVQKLTGSPAHPPHAPPKPACSRLHRIRPPPLAQFSSRPPSPLNYSLPPPNSNSFSGGIIRSTAPLSPLPPFPSCHGAAESPVSAYMRFLQNNSVDSDRKFHNYNSVFPDSFLQPAPSSPLAFGCLLSPNSPCPLLSPKLMFSPTGTGPVRFPVSPTVSGVGSPKWRKL